jgi:neutral amino acid transport system substrate-binding protein
MSSVRVRFASRLGVVLGVALACAVCGPRRTLGPDESDPVRIGLSVPLRGELGSDGASWRDAVRLAVREVNSAGGPLPGRSAELLIADSESTVEGAIAAYEALAAQGVVAIVGDAASSSTIAIYERIRASGRPIVLASGLSTSPRLTEINASLPADQRFFFRTVPPDDGQYRALADAMYQEGCRNIAILYADNDYGVPFRDGVREHFRILGGRVAIEQGYIEGLADYSAEVRAVAGAMPDCIALIAYPQSAGVIVRNWSMLGSRPSVRWFGTDGVYQPGFPMQVGDPMLIDGFLGTAPVTAPMTPAYNRFVASYRATFGVDPVAFASNLYDAAALILLAIARAGSTDAAAIRDAVRQINDPMGTPVQAGSLAEALDALRRPGRRINYEGASGSVDVDEFGNVRGQFELWRYDAAAGFVRVRILD